MVFAHSAALASSSAAAHPHDVKVVGHPNPTNSSVSKELPQRLIVTVVPGVTTAAAPRSRDSMTFGEGGQAAMPPHVEPAVLKGVVGKKFVVQPAAVESLYTPEGPLSSAWKGGPPALKHTELVVGVGEDVEVMELVDVRELEPDDWARIAWAPSSTAAASRLRGLRDPVIET